MKIVLATSNKGKVLEFKHLLQPYNMQIIPSSEFGITDIEETGLTFVENALLKARHAAQETALPTIADDSGLVVDVLQDEPGIHSARYAKDDPHFSSNIQKLLTKLQDVPFEQRTARFYCALVYLRRSQDPCPIICQGVWEGFILNQPKGEHGFGYDPIFYVPTHDCSAAELDLAEKNRISHRGQALQKLVAELQKEL